MDASAIDWSAVFGLSLSPLELFVRGTVMYWFLLLLFRFVVRRDVGAVGIADLLVLVIVADAAQNAMAGEYKTVTDGMVLVGTLIGWNVGVDWLAFRFPRFRRFAAPRPLPLVKDGQILRRNLRKELLTEDELWSHLRQAGIDSLSQVKNACMEEDGKISVVRRKR